MYGFCFWIFFLLAMSGMTGFSFLKGQNITLPARQYTVEDGLPDPLIQTLLQDSRGFLWIGTQNGLSCFDGRIFRNYFSHEGPDSISGNNITALVEDGAGILWIATLDGGLTRFDPSAPEGQRSQIFHHFPNQQNSIPVNRLHSLFDFNDEYLMISGEQASVVFLDKKSLEFRNWLGTIPLHPDNSQAGGEPVSGWVHSMVAVGNGGLMVSFLFNRQVWTINRETGKLLPGFAPAPIFFQDQTYTCLAYDETYQYAGGWQQGLSRWKRTGSTRMEKIPVPDEIESLLMLSDGKLLAGSRNKGLFTVESYSGVVSRAELFLSSGEMINPGKVTSIVRDKFGSCWLGTGSGLVCMNLKKSPDECGILLPFDVGKTIFNIDVSQQGKTMIFSSKGIYLEDGSGFSLHPFSYKNQPLGVTAIARSSPFGWILGAENGMFFMDSLSWKIQPFPPLKSSEGGNVELFDFLQVRDILTDSVKNHPSLILGFLGYGVGILDPSEMKISLFFRVSGCDSCLQSNLVQKILPDPEGGYWVATSQGLYHWNPESPPPKGSFRGFFSNSGKDGYLASDDIRDIVLDKQGTLWIATQKGLNSLKEGVIKSYHFQKKGNRAFHALIPMNEEELLIATHSGTALFNKVEKRFSHFWGQEITGTWQKGAKINSKEALIVGRNSWRKINLDSLKKAMEAPVPYLIGFQVNGKTQRSHSQALMGYNDYLTVWLSALHLQNAETFSIQYRWDEDAQLWQQAPQNGVLQLSGLRQGLHTLKVRVEDGNGIVSGETQLLQVKVTPPFWLSWPFILGVFLVLLGAVLGVQRYRFGQQQKQYAIRLGIAGDLHDEVGSALGSILIGSELAGKLLDEGKSKMIIENIRAIASQTMQNMSDIIWAIQPQHDSGEKLTVKMQQVGKELLIQQGILINCHFDAAIESLSFSMQARKNLMLIYKEVLHNISKHAEATRAEVEMHIQHRYLVMKITDNGKGFVIGNHTGNGLESMQRRAKNLSGNLAIESNLGQGTTVSLEVLLVNIKS